MKKNKNLSRAWFWSYIMLIFPGSLAALLSVKMSGALAVVFVVFSCIDLGLIIAAQVLYTKKRSLFPWFAFASQGLLSLLILYAMVVELVLTIMGQPAVYAWIIGSIGLVAMVFIDWAAIFYSMKIIRGETIIEGKQ